MPAHIYGKINGASYGIKSVMIKNLFVAASFSFYKQIWLDGLSPYGSL